MSSSRYGAILTLLSVALWGAQPLSIAAVIGHVSSSALAFYKMAFALLGVAGFQLARNGVPKVRGRSGLLLLAGAAGALALSSVTYNAGFRYVSPGSAVVYFLLSRVLLALTGIFAFREAFGRAQWLGMAVLAGGLALFFHDRLSMGGDQALGAALVLGSAAAWATYAVLMKLAIPHFGSSEALLLVYLGCVAVLAPYAEIGPLAQLSPIQGVALFFVCFSNVAAFACFSEALRHWDAAKIGAVSCLVPPVTVVLSLAFGHLVGARPETLTLLSAAGASLMVAGSVLVGRQK